MNDKRERVGLFGGTFDPIHYGHIQLANEFVNNHHVSQVWFCPAKMNPHKMDETSTPIQHRMNMVKLAIEDRAEFALLDCEAKRKGPSYTVDTVKELERKGYLQKYQMYLILSDESVSEFFRWKNPKEILKRVPLLIGTRKRSSKEIPDYDGDPEILKAIELGWTPTKDTLQISSTEIRERLRKGENCEQFVPKKVLDYIYQNNLYCMV